MTDIFKTITSMGKFYNVEMHDGKPLSDKFFVCCLCGYRWQGFGHNPAPLGNVETDRCCGPCNTTQVMPARLRSLYNENNVK